MRSTVFAAWALAFTASSAHAFLPAPCAAPSLITLRPAASTPVSATRGVHKVGCACAACHGTHTVGCSCGACSRSMGRRGAAKLSMVATGGHTADARIATEAAMLGRDSKTYCQTLEDLFPGAVDETKFIETMSRVVMEKGFNPKTSINLVSTCRDEICRPFTEKLDGLWGESFNIASLGGFVFCGKTGFGAGMAHSPQADGKERYIFWVAPHVAVGSDGAVGKIWRPGRDSISSACGALIALNGEIERMAMRHGLDPTDTEMSLVRQQIIGKLTYGQQPNLVGITYAAHDCIKDQVETTAKLAAPDSSEYVIISGVQIHGALGKNFWWPGSITHYADGKATDLSDVYNERIASYDLPTWLQAEAIAEAQKYAGKARLNGFFSEFM